MVVPANAVSVASHDCRGRVRIPPHGSPDALAGIIGIMGIIEGAKKSIAAINMVLTILRSLIVAPTRLMMMVVRNGIALVILLIEHEADKWQANRPPRFLLGQFSALRPRDVNGVGYDAHDARAEYNDSPRKRSVAYRRTWHTGGGKSGIKGC